MLISRSTASHFSLSFDYESNLLSGSWSTTITFVSILKAGQYQFCRGHCGGITRMLGAPHNRVLDSIGVIRSTGGQNIRTSPGSHGWLSAFQACRRWNTE